MHVIICTDSTALNERLSTILSQFSDIDKIDATNNLDEAEASIIKNDAEVLIIAFHNIQKNIFKKLSEIKKSRANLIVIVLTNNPTEQYLTFWKNSGADFVFDQAIQFNELVDVLSGLIYKKLLISLRTQKEDETNQI